MDKNIEPLKKRTKNVIDDLEFAKSVFTLFKLFVKDRMDKYRNNNPNYSKEHIDKYKNNLQVLFKKLLLSTKDEWIAKSEEKLHQQPFIKDQIILALQDNPLKGYRELADDIRQWCSKNSIFNWLHNQEGFRTYTERIVLLLTEEQRQKQKAFASHFLNNWNLPYNQMNKVLLVNYNEKWFYGLVPRSGAKQCESIGLQRHMKVVYHKNFINKFMVIAVTGYAFQKGIEFGGDRLKIALC